MSMVEGIAQISDVAVAELVECAPPPDAPLVVVLPTPPGATPVTDAMAATIEQTGAGPPPRDR